MRANSRSNSPSAPFDVMAVGDVAADVFMRLDSSLVETDALGRHSIVLPLGAKIPFSGATVIPAGGNAANAAVCAARLGLHVGLISYVGGDGSGREVVAGLEAEAVDTRLVRVDPGVPTNRHFVLWCGDDRTILVHHQRYDYHWPYLRPSEVPRWVYLTSAGEHALSYHDQLADWLDEHPEVRLAFQPGTFQIAAGAERLARLYRRSDVLVCNREEAVTIGGGDFRDVDDLLECLRRLGPRIAVVTDGPRGADAADGQRRYYAPAVPDALPPVDRTGAGDAFAATCVAALVIGHGIADALSWAAINAASAVSAVGAQAGLLREKELLERVEQRGAGDTVP
jgi:ribokinase